MAPACAVHAHTHVASCANAAHSKPRRQPRPPTRPHCRRAEWLGLFEEGGIHGFDEVSEMGFRKDADKGTALGFGFCRVRFAYGDGHGCAGLGSHVVIFRPKMSVRRPPDPSEADECMV